jgi:phosphate starvation-inducible protein PhoH and related proteins
LPAGMEDLETEFILSGTDPVLFYGANDRNLKIIEKHFEVSLLGRGDLIKIVGPQTQVKQVEDLLRELVLVINRNKNLTRTDLMTLIQIIKGEAETVDAASRPEAEQNSVIIYTPAGNVKPSTAGQQQYCQAVEDNDIVFCIGPAGTGKTYLAVAMAMAYLNKKKVNKIILSRPAVEAGENLGYLPGDYREKINPYLTPLYDALENIVAMPILRKQIDQGIIEVIPLAYMRGRTLNNAFVLLDEGQNCTFMQMKMFLTRLGVNSKCIVNGDITQIDLPKTRESGLLSIQNILQGIAGIRFVYLDSTDVIRHKLVKDIINAYAKDETHNPAEQ